MSLLLAVVSCEEDLTSLNEDPKRPEVVSYETLFSNAQLSLTDIITSSNVKDNIFRLIVQYWTETTYLDETRYNLASRNIPQNFWHVIYRDVLSDFSRSKSLLEENTIIGEAEKNNQLAIIDIMEVYTWSVLVQTFGDIPYQQALDIDNIRPEYTDQEEIFNDLLTRLDQSLGTMDVSAGSFGSADLVYGGDVASWIKFANSLKLRLGMTLADVNPTQAASVVAAAAPNVFTSNADNAMFEYSTIPPNTNPIWVDLVQSGRQDFIAATTIVDVMDSLSDPRVKYFFTPDGDPADEDGMYSGGIVGVGNSFSVYSKPGANITQADFPSILLSYDEVSFLLSEAAARGFGVAGTAEEHYNNAITASVLYWGGTEAEAQTYLAQPEVAYTTAGSEGSFKEKIGHQKWIALYNRGFESWTEWRRLGYPQLEPAIRAVSAIPVRYTYPISEQNLNKPNFEAAAAAVGGDEVTTKLFWDVE